MRNSNSAMLLLRYKGLTLIELLVAITVLAFVAVIGWQGLDSIVRARITLTNDLENTRGMQLAFAQLQSDCAHLATNILPDRVPLAIEAGRLKLVRTVFADNQPSRLQVVTYAVSNGVLTRQESAVTRDLKELDAMWQADASDASIPVVALQPDVAELTMRLWSAGGWHTPDSGLEPVPSAGPATNPLLPTGLEVKLQLRGRDTSLLKIFLLGAI